MARITYERAIKCKRCGTFRTSIDAYKHHVLCQNCGTHIMDFDCRTKEGTVTQNAEIITVKVTHKPFFREIYEEVK